MAFKTVESTVTVKLENLDGSERKIEAPVKYLQFDDFDSVLHYINLVAEKRDERRKEATSNINAALAQAARSSVRQEVVERESGPEKAVAKMAAQLFKAREKANRPISQAQARKLAVASYEAAMKVEAEATAAA